MKSLHPFYFGWLDMFIQGNRAHIVMKFFVNDLESCLRKYHPDVDILHDEYEKLHPVLNTYVKTKFFVLYDLNKQAELSPVSYKSDGEVFLIFLGARFDAEPKSLKIRCSMLFDGIPSQTNIVKIHYQQKNQTFFLNYTEPEKSVILN
ncbi:MAG: hypothetical protein N3F09_07265 [Bacteroidia bacterium]|nr:hypothetical protein [Bacteroidia bacterium]